MADILPFKKRSPKVAQKLGMCGHGHHKWRVAKSTQFDVKSGKLVTRLVCERCGKTRVKGT